MHCVNQGETCPVLPASCKNASGSMADRCGQFCKGPQTKDPNFVYMQHGQLHLGNFSDSVPIATGASRADVSSSTTTAAPKLEWGYQLQVEGSGYIRNLSHGLPHRRLGLADPGVETVDEEPVVLSGVDSHLLHIGNIACDGAAYYEVTVAGVGHGGACQPGPCVYSARYMVVPISSGGAASVTALGAASGVALEPDNADAQGVLLRLTAAGSREVVVDVRRAGRPCRPAMVGFV